MKVVPMLPRCVARASRGFKIGDQVTYWSNSHKVWMEAVVLRLNLCDQGRLESYDLDVRAHARPELVRRLSPGELEGSRSEPSISRVDAMCSFGVEVTLLSGRSFPMACLKPWDKLKTFLDQVHGATGIPKCNLRLLVDMQTFSYKDEHLQLDEVGVARGASLVVVHAEPEQDIFAENDAVEYWSKTHEVWMKARVLKVHSDGDRYDLDVKKQASWRYITRFQRSAPVEPSAVSDAGVEAPDRRQQARTGGA